MEDYYDQFLWLCVVIPQQPNDIYLRKAFREGLQYQLGPTSCILMQHSPSDQYAEYDDFRSLEYESYPWELVVNSSCILKDHLHIYYILQDRLCMNYILKEHMAMDHFHEDQLNQLRVHILVVDDLHYINKS